MKKYSITNNFKALYERFLSLKGEPRTIALSMAIGVFIGVTPTIPFHTTIIVLLCFIFRQNITAAILGSWIISNPVTIPLFYVSEYHLGKLLLKSNNFQVTFNDYYVWTFFEKGWKVAVPLLTGGIIMATFFAVLAYFITYRLVLAVRKNRNQ
ncbi:MAG: DUF2062 domain-containing protein [Syntrophales bacterium]